MAPVESQASDKTEWTICAVSIPMLLRLLSNSRSRGVEKMIGVGVDKRATKSWCKVEGGGRGVGVLSNSPGTLSDKRDETERRLVRAGVRIFDGGAFEPDELDQETGRIRADFDSGMSSSSGTVSGCRVSRGDKDSMSESDVLRMVVLLGFW
jgi:hypothetical protein